MQIPILETDRLLLRPFTSADVSSVTPLASAREVAATTLRIPHPYTETDAERFINTLPALAEKGVTAVFAITARASGDLYGGIALEIENDHRRAELGYWIGVPYWGRGYATEAARAVLKFGFATLGLNRIFAFHFAHNPASGKVLRKIGMTHEGRMRQHIYKWGQAVDSELYGILRSEFTSAS